MSKQLNKIAESQRSFIYMELDELYENSTLPEFQKQEIHHEFKLFLETISDIPILTQITDAVYEMGASEEDPLASLLTLKKSYSEKQQLIKA